MCSHVKFTLMSDISDCSTFLHFAVQLPKNLIQEVSPSCPWFLGRMVTHEALALKAPLRQLERTLYSSIASHALRWKDRFGMWWLWRLIRTFHRRRDAGVSLRKEAAAPSPIRRGPYFRPVKSSSRLSFHSSWTRTWAALIVLWDLWNYSQYVPHGVERASASLSVWPFIIIGLTQAHRVTSELLLPLLTTAGGGKKSPLENNLFGHLQANEQMNWRGAERCVLRTEHASEGDLSSRSFTCASLGKWCSGVQRKSSLFVNENEEQRYRESSSHQKVGWPCHFVPSASPAIRHWVSHRRPRFPSLSPLLTALLCSGWVFTLAPFPFFLLCGPCLPPHPILSFLPPPRSFPSLPGTVTKKSLQSLMLGGFQQQCVRFSAASWPITLQVSVHGIL